MSSTAQSDQTDRAVQPYRPVQQINMARTNDPVAEDVSYNQFLPHVYLLNPITSQIEHFGRFVAIIIHTSRNIFVASDMGKGFAHDSVTAYCSRFPGVLTRYLVGYFEHRIQRFEVSDLTSYCVDKY